MHGDSAGSTSTFPQAKSFLSPKGSLIAMRGASPSISTARKLMRSALLDLWPPKLRKPRSKGLFDVPWLEALRPLANSLLKERQLHVVERGFVGRTSFLSRQERLSAGLDCNEPQLRRVDLRELWLRNRGQSRLSEAGLEAA